MADLTSAPPALDFLTDAELDALCVNGNPPLFSEMPSHTQTVERTVKLVSAASHRVCGFFRRHGVVLATLEGRRWARMET